MQINGAQAVLKALEHEGVETVFGMPGGAILPVYDPLIESSIRHILVRHEQGAGHMASGYAHATGKPGVAIVTSGPAATNMVTALLDAMMDSIPMVCITGQVALPAIGTDAFQEADTTGITMSATKHNYLVTKVEDIPQVIHDAFHLATTGRPGPVLVDIPKDLVLPDAVFEWYEPTGHDLPGYNPKTEGDPASIAEAAKMIMAAKRPVIYSGGGILRSRAADELRTLAEMTDIPVVTTLMNRGGFPDHELNLGMPGMHGNYTAVMAMQEADLLIALGARFDDRVTGARDKFAPDAKVIHVDIDPAELGKVRFAHVPIAGDAKSIITEMIKEIEKLGGADGQPDRDAWRQTLSGWQEKYPLVYGDHEPGKLLKPQFVIEKLAEACPPDTILCSGVGQHQMWASQYWTFNHPYTWINSGGLGTMGYSIPAAVGAKAGMPDRMVWAVDGDGCFQMTSQELITAAVEHIPVKVAILNNSWLGMVRQWQELFYDERFSETHFGSEIPNYKMWAEAMGCVGFRVDSPEEVVPTIQKANEINDRPVVIDFRTQAEENVYPMVPAGASNSEVLVDPSQRDADSSGETS